MLVLFSVALVASVVRVSMAGQCVMLKECEPLFALYKNRDSVPGMTRAEVMASIRRQLCGNAGRYPKVICNQPEEEHLTSDQIQSARRERGGVWDASRNQPLCEGTLKLFHLNGQGTDAKALVLKHPQYAHLARLEGRNVFTSEVGGTCCWQISQNRAFAGRHEALAVGHRGEPQLQPRSAKQLICV